MRRTSFPVLLTLLAACWPGDRAADDTAANDTLTGTALGIPSAPAAPMTIADVGLQTPESVLYDEGTDSYLVSNINGSPLDRDGNGFIARVRPTGEVETLKWIDGEAEGVTLHAPKGMALRGDTLYVADIDSVRAFHRADGRPLAVYGVPRASFLNDVASGESGVYVSDTGVDASFSPTGTDAIHRLGDSGTSAFAVGSALSRPNGIAVVGATGDVLVVPFGGNSIMRVPAGGGQPTRVTTLPAGQLDGLVLLDDGSMLVSSWEGSAVYRVTADGQVTTVAEGLEAPADLGWDSQRQRVLIPLFNGNRIEVREVR